MRFASRSKVLIPLVVIFLFLLSLILWEVHRLATLIWKEGSLAVGGILTEVPSNTRENEDGPGLSHERSLLGPSYRKHLCLGGPAVATTVEFLLALGEPGYETKVWIALRTGDIV